MVNNLTIERGQRDLVLNNMAQHRDTRLVGRKGNFTTAFGIPYLHALVGSHSGFLHGGPSAQMG